MKHDKISSLSAMEVYPSHLALLFGACQQPQHVAFVSIAVEESMTKHTGQCTIHDFGPTNKRL